MATLAFLLAAFLDPVQAALVLAIVLGYRGPQPILIAAAVAATASETIMMLAAADYTWGELVVPRLASSLMQAAVLCPAVRLIRKHWMGLARPDSERLQGSPLTTLRSLMTGAATHRLAPWHMRAYVRRRLIRLRSR
jgi:hypothetical protein